MDERLKGELMWINIDLQNPQDRAKFRRQQAERAGKRIRAAVKKLQDAGILDKNARRVRQDIPPDMCEGSKTDFGG